MTSEYITDYDINYNGSIYEYDVIDNLASFFYDHLKHELREISQSFFQIAESIFDRPDISSQNKAKILRPFLIAKDAAVRAKAQGIYCEDKHSNKKPNIDPRQFNVAFGFESNNKTEVKNLKEIKFEKILKAMRDLTFKIYYDTTLYKYELNFAVHMLIYSKDELLTHWPKFL